MNGENLLTSPAPGLALAFHAVDYLLKKKKEPLLTALCFIAQKKNLFGTDGRMGF